MFDVLETQKRNRKISNSNAPTNFVNAMFPKRHDTSRYRWIYEVTSVQIRSHWNQSILENLFVAPVRIASADTVARELKKNFANSYIPKKNSRSWKKLPGITDARIENSD